jgi:hypothetical protein
MMVQEAKQQLPKNTPDIISLPSLPNPLAIELHERSEVYGFQLLLFHIIT